MSDQSIDVCVGRTLEFELFAADVKQSLVIENDGNVGVIEERMSGKDSVVGLDSDIRGWVDNEI